ncbi:MAG TPA: RraA family protein [Acidobacteriota bacterium]|nr:RraA family protein [Acidobacteriota bacterium]
MSDLSIRQRIIKKIKTNRISTTEVADCLGKTGNIPEVLPLSEGHFEVGEVYLAYCYNESNWPLHRQLEEVQPGQVVIVETHNCGTRAAFGDLVSKFGLLYREASAMVVNGYLRDAHNIKKHRYPVWCRGITPIGCFNRQNQHDLEASVLQKWRKEYEGGIAVCDDGGVVVVPSQALTEDFLQKLDFIELQEDIWYYCLDVKKWSTYRTVCLKDYLDTELLPGELRDRFAAFQEEVGD